MNSPSPTSSVSSGCIHSEKEKAKNGPQKSAYIRSHKSISFSFSEGSDSFQHGQLGDEDSFLVGTLHLNYQKPCQIKSVHLHFKGFEKTLWQRSQARTKTFHSGEYTLVDQTNKIWESYNDVEEVTTLDIPFKVQLPYNLPETITTEVGTIQYLLRATVNTKTLIGSGQQSVKLFCPLKRIFVLDHQHCHPYKMSGETPNGIDYLFILPPNKSLNLGTYVSIPMKLRLLRANTGIERIEVFLRTTMEFHSATQGDTKKMNQQIMGLVVPRSELPWFHGECTYTINLFVPKNVQPTYQGRFITISHFLSIKFHFWGDEGVGLEENVRIAHIVEKQSGRSPLTPQVTPPLPPDNMTIPSPILHTHSQYQQHHHRQPMLKQRSFEHTNRNYEHHYRPLMEHSRSLYDRPFDGYNASSSLNLPPYESQRLDYGYHRSERPETPRSQPISSGTSSHSSYEMEASTSSSSLSNEILNDHISYPTQLSPPPYRQPEHLRPNDK